MKEIKKSIILFILMVIAILLAPSCTKEPTLPSPCDGNCDSYFEVIYKNTQIFISPDNYYYIDWDGLDYFQITGSLTPLNDRYVINEVPLIETRFDTDYWVVFDSIMFQTPMYSYLGWFNSNTLNTPIPFGNYTYTMNDLISLHPPLNVAGYQIPRNLCMECPYSPTLVGSYSKYNYTPTQNFLLDDEMVGDTINVFIETIFNSDVGEREIVEKELNIIII